MSLINTLRSRTTELAEKTRDRGIDMLGKVRDGTLDWHRTLEARRAEIDTASAPKWFQLGGLQIFVINRFDHALNVFGDKVREEIRRLQKLELETPGQSEVAQSEVAQAAEAPMTAPVLKAASKKAPAKKTAKASAARSAGKSAAKAKQNGTSAAAKAKVAPKSKPNERKSRPAAKRPSGKTATRRFIMPIASYDELTAKEVIGEVHRLTAAQCKTVRAHEASHKKRKTVLSALDARLAS